MDKRWLLTEPDCSTLKRDRQPTQILLTRLKLQGSTLPKVALIPACRYSEVPYAGNVFTRQFSESMTHRK